MHDSPNEKKFMREKVVKPKASKGRAAGKLICLVLFAVIFGMVSAVSFVLSLPLAQKHFGKEPTVPSVPITIEKDNEPTITPTTMETMEPTAPEIETEPGDEPENEEEMIREIVRDELSQDGWTIDKVKGFNQVLMDIAKDADKSIVTISSVKHERDWFDNPVENTGQYSGMILAVNASEVVILTGDQAIEGADALKISFGDGTSASAWVKQTDTVAGLATIGVNSTELTTTTSEWIEPVELGNSYSLQTGNLLVAVGSPAGHVRSMKHGTVTYISKSMQAVDGLTRVIYTDMDCNVEKGTFFLNLAGQLVGWATSQYTEESCEDGTIAMSISEYKGHLQRLSNGRKIPYIGLMGQDVTPAMQEEGVPDGIYIMEAAPDSPAYAAGIQSGDILTKLQGEPVLTIRDFQNKLEELDSGTEAALMIQRKGLNEYREIEYNITIGAR